ncbi:hypothetical protein, partial [Roseivivax marinus]|uniref:hypothetical protein n=1 Tax=Roseivivax marinus TaxID=1379903 RepID=UPI001C31DB17
RGCPKARNHRERAVQEPSEMGRSGYLTDTVASDRQGDTRQNFGVPRENTLRQRPLEIMLDPAGAMESASS